MLSFNDKLSGEQFKSALELSDPFGCDELARQPVVEVKGRVKRDPVREDWALLPRLRQAPQVLALPLVLSETHHRCWDLPQGWAHSQDWVLHRGCPLLQGLAGFAVGRTQEFLRQVHALCGEDVQGPSPVRFHPCASSDGR